MKRKFAVCLMFVCIIFSVTQLQGDDYNDTNFETHNTQKMAKYPERR